MRFLMSGFLLLLLQPGEIFDRKLANPQTPPPKKKNVTQEETQKNVKKLELVKQGAFKKAPFKA
jgi:hypothetical protein